MKLFVLSLALVLSAFSANTTVVGTYNNAEGRPANGTLVLTVTRSFTNDGKTVLVSRRSYSIRNGTLSLSLVPNVGSTPASYYSVSTSIENGPVEVSNWIVPFSATPVTVASVTSVMPPPPPDFFLPLSQLSTSGAILDYVIKFNGTSPVWAAAPGGNPAASAVTFSPTGSISSTNVQAAIAELGNEKQAALGFTPENSANRGASNGYAPLDSSSKVPSANLPTATASGTTFSATGGISSTNVQSALSELDTEKQAALGFTPENSANRNVAGGYAPLDGSTKVPLANLPNIPESQLTLNNPTHSNANDPSSGEKAALAGTSGTPGSGNKYVTDEYNRPDASVTYATAYCNGTYNNACLTAAVAALPSGIAILDLGGREFTLTSTWTVSRAQTIIQNGTLKAGTNLNSSLISVAQRRVTLREMTLNGNRANQSATSVCVNVAASTWSDLHNTEIRRVRFLNCRDYALKADNVSGLLISDSYFGNTGASHISLGSISGSSYRSNDVSIRSNYFDSSNQDNALINSAAVVELYGPQRNLVLIGNVYTTADTPFFLDDSTSPSTASTVYACAESYIGVSASVDGSINGTFVTADGSGVTYTKCYSQVGITIPMRSSGAALPSGTDTISSAAAKQFIVPVGSTCYVKRVTFLIQSSASSTIGVRYGTGNTLNSTQVSSLSSIGSTVSVTSGSSMSNRSISNVSVFMSPESFIIPYVTSGSATIDYFSMTVYCSI